MNVEALVLEKQNELSIREIEVDDSFTNIAQDDVLVEISHVGICGSDVHYYEHGRIGDFVVNQPMILGHEASGTVIKCGENVNSLQPGDRVCIEPGVPNFKSKATLSGKYNLDKDVSFWATPPVHGCLTKQISHPASLVYKLPDNVSMADGALIEPLAVGVYSVSIAEVVPGDVVLIFGAGTIGLLTALAARALGCAKVIIADISDEKLSFFDKFDDVFTVNTKKESLSDIVDTVSRRQGVNIIFEASGSEKVFENITDYCAFAAKIILIGMPTTDVKIDVIGLQVKEITIKSVFRYANVWERALDLVSSKKIDLTGVVSKTYNFNDSIDAFKRASEKNPSDIKIQIKL